MPVVERGVCIKRCFHLCIADDQRSVQGTWWMHMEDREMRDWSKSWNSFPLSQNKRYINFIKPFYFLVSQAPSFLIIQRFETVILLHLPGLPPFHLLVTPSPRRVLIAIYKMEWRVFIQKYPRVKVITFQVDFARLPQVQCIFYNKQQEKFTFRSYGKGYYENIIKM